MLFRSLGGVRATVGRMRWVRVCDVHHVSCCGEARDVVAGDLSMCGQREEEISRDGGQEMKGEGLRGDGIELVVDDHEDFKGVYFGEAQGSHGWDGDEMLIESEVERGKCCLRRRSNVKKERWSRLIPRKSLPVAHHLEPD